MEFQITALILSTLIVSHVNINAQELGIDEIRTRCKIPGVVSITFDDGPWMYTDGILDLLKEKNVTTTFFLSNVWWSIYEERTQAVIRRAVAEGHTIGCHTWNHANLTTLTPDQIKYEINQLSNTLVELGLLNEKPKQFRPPYGSFNREVKFIVEKELNNTMVNWSIDTWDWDHPGDTEAGMQEYYLHFENSTKLPGEIMGFVALHHDVQFGGVELASRAIDYVRSKGFRMVSVEECLGLN